MTYAALRLERSPSLQFVVPNSNRTKCALRPVLRRCEWATRSSAVYLLKSGRRIVVRLLRKLLGDQYGQDLIEYALLAAFVTTLAIVALSEIGNKLGDYFASTADRVNSLSAAAASGGGAGAGGGGSSGGSSGGGSGGSSGGGASGGSGGSGGNGGGKAK